MNDNVQEDFAERVHVNQHELFSELRTRFDYIVCGIDSLRIANASILPRVTTGNTMAPCVVIGERAAEILRTDRKA